MTVPSRSVRAFVLGGATVALVLVAFPERSGGGGGSPVTTERSAVDSMAALPGGRAVRVQPIQPGDEPIQPIPEVREVFEDHLEIDYEPAKIELGRKLFHDPRLSHDDTISCASCHDLRFGGVDRSGTAIGVEG